MKVIDLSIASDPDAGGISRCHRCLILRVFREGCRRGAFQSPISIHAGMPVNALRHITAAHDADFFYGAKVPKRVPDSLSLLSAATIQKDRVAKLHTM